MEPCIRIMFSERSPHHRNRVKQVIKTQRDFEIIFEGKSILEDNKNRLIEKTDIFVVGLDKFQTGWDLILSPLVNLSRKTKILILSEPMQGEMML